MRFQLPTCKVRPFASAKGEGCAGHAAWTSRERKRVSCLASQCDIFRPEIPQTDRQLRLSLAIAVTAGETASISMRPRKELHNARF